MDLKSRLLGDLPPPPVGKSGWPWTVGDAGFMATGGRDGAMPKVTVVTPSFNQGEYIEETIRSVLLQGYQNIEYIVMDGGSTDHSKRIIEKYGRFLAFWSSGSDAGQSDAINRGWRRGNGEIVSWLNSDDIYYPGTVMHAVAALRDHPEAAMVFGAGRVLDSTGTEIGLQSIPEFDIELMLRTCNNLVPSPTAFLRQSALKKVGLLDTGLHYAMDFDLFVRIGLAWPAVLVPGLTAGLRVHGGAKSSAMPVRGAKEAWEIVRKTFVVRDADPRVGRACVEGMAIGAVRVALELWRTKSRARALGWRLKASVLALRGLWAVDRCRRPALLALLLPGRAFPLLRRRRADVDGSGLVQTWFADQGDKK